MALIRALSGSSGGGGENSNKYQTFATNSGGTYVIIYKGDIVKDISSGSSGSTYEDDNISWTITSYGSGLWSVTNKSACKFSQNNGAQTSLSANTTKTCSYTGGVYEFDFS